MHMTLRRRDDLPSFRRQRVLALVHHLMKTKADAAFQIVHYSIQSNHIHLICEARDRRVVTRKMQGFMIAFAKRLNKMLGNRRGKVWADRYFARDVVDSRDMHNVLSYVFGNAKKHGASNSMFDVFASWWAFPGWDVGVLTYGIDDWPRPPPRTAMLREWWKLHGPVRSGLRSPS